MYTYYYQGEDEDEWLTTYVHVKHFRSFLTEFEHFVEQLVKELN